MAYCANCGKEISPAARACPQCGHPAGVATATAVEPHVQPPTEGFAVASLACSIAGILGVFFVGSILGIVFSHVARRKLREHPGREGEGLATAGLIIGWVGIALGILGLIMILLFLEAIEDIFRGVI